MNTELLRTAIMDVIDAERWDWYSCERYTSTGKVIAISQDMANGDRLDFAQAVIDRYRTLCSLRAAEEV